MRLTFDPSADENEFQQSRGALLEDMGRWAAGQDVAVDVSDVGMALDWKRDYAGGDLSTWTVGDLDEFLLTWCPRKLSMEPQFCAEFARSVGMLGAYLHDRGLLAPGSSSPQALRDGCERGIETFRARMADPTWFGMAKSILGGVDPDQLPDDLSSLAGRIDPRLPAGLGELLGDHGPNETDDESPVIGPVRLPDADAHAASAAETPVLLQVRALREYCQRPGRTLTSKGNLRLADARELVTRLETGDVTDTPERSLRSAEDLPVLDWVVELAVDTRAVRRHGGRLVAVAAWDGLTAVDAQQRLVDAVWEEGLTGQGSGFFPAFRPLVEVVEYLPVPVLMMLLVGGTQGEALEIDQITDSVEGVARQAAPGLFELAPDIVSSSVRRTLDTLEALGVVTQDGVARVADGMFSHPEGGRVELTPAGVAEAVRLVSAEGIEVVTRPDPATATASDLVATIGLGDPDAWVVDVAAWAGTPGREDPAAALGTALEDAPQGALGVVSALGELENALGADAPRAVEALLGGPHDGLAVAWLVERGLLDPDTLPVERRLAGMVDLLAANLDAAAPEDVVGHLTPVERDRQVELFGDLWRLDHPRVGEVLDALGRHHPDKKVAKAARKAAVKHRSRIANRPRD